MKWLVVTGFIACTSCSHTYYVVRHAEKAQASAGAMVNTGNPPLTPAGTKRALALKEVLKHKKIRYIYSTNTVRTLATAAPLSEYLQLAPVMYGNVPDAAFITTLKSLRRNALIVGHSNTVDDIVNGLSGALKIPGDLPDSAYDNLYEVKFTGKKVKFKAGKYGGN